MREQAFRFGRADHLVGIAGLPSAAGEAVGVIVLNAGLVHRVGPFRMNVELTRRLAAAGYPTLRFDLSTLGDSGATGEALSRIEQVRADVADAMDLLARQAGCRRFVLAGLCSGAQNAHTVACTEQRVAGVVFLDGYAYRTFGHRLRHYLPRLLSLRRIVRFLARRQRDEPAAEALAFDVEVPPRGRVRAEIADMLERGLRLSFIYSGGISKYFNHARQFGECFGALSRHPAVSVAYLAETDHTFVLAGDRARLVDRVQAWLEQQFPVGGMRP